MKRIISAIIVASGLAIAISSCQKAPQITIITPTTLEMSADGSSDSITFSANQDWTISCSESWIHVNPSSGGKTEEAVTVTVRCDPNTTYEDRMATVTIKAEDVLQTVAIKQQQNLGIILPKQTFDIEANRQSIEVEVQANTEYTISVSADWIKQAGTKSLMSKTLLFNIEDNASYNDREGKIIFKQVNGELMQYVLIRQQSALKAVDLGLSVKWANVNLGAYAEDEYGDFFAWGETITKDEYTWETYKWCHGTNTTITKYNSNPNFGDVDNKMSLDLEDDAARAILGGEWRLPTIEEIQELLDNCTWTWTRHYDISFQLDGSGYTVVSKINGNSIYLPLAGFFDHDKNDMTIWVGQYLSSTIGGSTEYVSALGLLSSRAFTSNMPRYAGVSVRPVIKP